jgi:hypothetical protein
VDRLAFIVEDVPDSGIARRQAVPLINGERLTALLGLIIEGDPPEKEPLELNIGFDPDDAFLPSRHYLEPTAERNPEGTTLLLRCCCGVWGCSYVAARIEITNTEVWWREIHGCDTGPITIQPGHEFHFDRAQYEGALRGPGP